MSSKKLPSFWLCYFLVPINIYGDYIERVTGKPALYINAATIIVFFALSFLFGKYKNKWPVEIVVFLCMNIAIVICHILLDKRLTGEIKHLLYVLLFSVVAVQSDYEIYHRLKKVILFVTIPMTLDAFYWLPRIKRMGYRLFNIRNYTMIDKTFYTLIFPIALIVLFNWFLREKKSVKRIFPIIWMAPLFYVIFSVVESKMGILAFGFAIIVEVFTLKKEYRKRIRRICFILLLSAVMVITLFLTGVLHVPDYVLAGISYIFGDYTAVNRVYYETYFTRLEILRNCLIIWSRFPIIGLGFGGYYPYVTSQGMQNYSLGISDIESAAMAMLVEGGIVYFLANVLLYAAMIRRLKRNYTLLRDSANLIGILACLLFLLIGNDFMSVFYWVLLGTLYGVIKKRMAGNLIYGKTI